jgi:N-hydroxyarylamine O-acetyltransferase
VTPAVPPVPRWPDRSPEWGADRLDLAAYLGRIGYAGSCEPTVASLFELHRRHMAAVVFENVDLAIGREVAVDVDSIQRKIVGRGRGGYCYESNLLFAAALDRIGFPVTRLLTRIREGSTKRRFRSHTALLVRAGGRVWLTDPAYGYAGPVQPLPLEDGAPTTVAGWSWRLVVEDDGHWLLQDWAPRGWVDLYAFRCEPQFEPDYQAAHWVTSTRPTSPFVGHLVVQRGGEKLRHRLRDDVLLTEYGPGERVEETLTGPQVLDTLRRTFDLELTDDEEQRLLAFLRR